MGAWNFHYMESKKVRWWLLIKSLEGTFRRLQRGWVSESREGWVGIDGSHYWVHGWNWYRAFIGASQQYFRVINTDIPFNKSSCTPLTSHPTPLTSHSTPLTSQPIHMRSHSTVHTCDVTPHTFDVTSHSSDVTPPPLWRLPLLTPPYHLQAFITPCYSLRYSSNFFSIFYFYRLAGSIRFFHISLCRLWW